MTAAKGFLPCNGHTLYFNFIFSPKAYSHVVISHYIYFLYGMYVFSLLLLVLFHFFNNKWGSKNYFIFIPFFLFFYLFIFFVRKFDLMVCLVIDIDNYARIFHG